jgi:hypothetical protein
MEDPGSQMAGGTGNSTGQITSEQKDLVYRRLVLWRLKIWRKEWEEEWLSYGPDSLVSNADLENVAKHARGIRTLEQLYAITQILHWEELSTPLLDSLKGIVSDIWGTPIADEVLPPPAVSAHSVATQNPGESRDLSLRARGKVSVGKLSEWEGVLDFS